MKYISAQPDTPYFHWQLKVQMSNFRELGIEQDAIIVLGYRGRPSKEGLDFQNQTEAIVIFIEDKRTELPYVSSIRPHILKRVDIFKHHDVIYHDSDVLFSRVPDVTGKVTAVSDANYISAKYIIEKSPQLFRRMCHVVGIDSETVKANDYKVGGAQYYFPKLPIGLQFWEKVENDSVELFKLMQSTSKIYSSKHPIQAWTADMWALIWNLWYLGIETKIDSELAFSWPMDGIETIKPIFHLAGITKNDAHTHFFKGDYINKSPFGAKLHCDETRAYSFYVNQIRKAEKIFS